MSKKVSVDKATIQAGAHQQVQLALVLMSVIPTLVVLFMSVVLYHPSWSFSPVELIVILSSTFLLVFAGYLIMRRYSENIMRLRKYISDIAEGTLPDTVTLFDSGSSDDIQFIEENFNAILTEMRARIDLIESQLRREKELRDTIESQQQHLIRAEQYRTMVQSLGAACHHIGQPATALGMHLFLLKESVKNKEASQQIDACIQDLDLIGSVLEKLQRVSTFKTEPYIANGEKSDCEILDID